MRQGTSDSSILMLFYLHLRRELPMYLPSSVETKKASHEFLRIVIITRGIRRYLWVGDLEPRYLEYYQLSYHELVSVIK